MMKSVEGATIAGERNKIVSDVLRHRSGTGKSDCRTRFDVGLERIKYLGIAKKKAKKMFT
jgi:hypothetical protein